MLVNSRPRRVVLAPWYCILVLSLVQLSLQEQLQATNEELMMAIRGISEQIRTLKTTMSDEVQTTLSLSEQIRTLKTTISEEVQTTITKEILSLKTKVKSLEGHVLKCCNCNNETVADSINDLEVIVINSSPISVEEHSEASFDGPYENIWSDAQCNKVGSTQVGVSLKECQSLCKKISPCNAINYKDGLNSDCVLRACGLPVPAPEWNYPPYKGYVSASASFDGPYENIWSDAQCNTVSLQSGVSLKECQSLCKKISTCNAINYKDGLNSDCVLRACGWPVPAPEWNYPPYKGYLSASGKDCSTEEGYFQVGHQCFFLPFGHINETSWNNAQEICDSQGGTLAEPKNIPEFQKAVQKQSFGKKFWLGGSDRMQEGVWRWTSDGVKVDNFDSWHSGEPNNFGDGGEDCLMMARSLERPLYDDDCGGRKKWLFICERK